MAPQKKSAVLATPVAPAAGITGGSTPPNSVYQGQDVQFAITWPPQLAAPQQGTFTFTWNILPDPTTNPTSYQYNNVTPVTDSNGNLTGTFIWDTSDVEPGLYDVSVTLKNGTGVTEPLPDPTGKFTDQVSPSQITVKLRPVASGDTVPVTMQRAVEPQDNDAALWVVIRNTTNQLSFINYQNFVDSIMCPTGPEQTIDSLIEGFCQGSACFPTPLNRRRFTPFPNMDAYRVLKVATECFLMLNCGVFVDAKKLSDLVHNNPPSGPGGPLPPPTYDLADDEARLNWKSSNLPDQITKWWNDYLKSGNQFLNPLDPKGLIIPYLALVRSRLKELPITKFCALGMECLAIMQRKLTNPCLIELIWSYWHEEGMLVQTLNAVSRRFQNLRGPADRDPLTRFDIDPLRPLNSFLWGYVQDEQHRLTVMRRAYEYNHEYGLTLEGKAVRALRPSDSRSKFLEAFHNLLYLCTIFFKEDDDTTVVADGFPVLNALKEVHYMLAAGAANQFGELPSNARQEMLMQQWLLARTEMREFLGGKIMVPYPETWMDRVDNVKSMQGWTDVSVVHFHDLAVYGEQIVLSVRYGAWSLTTTTAAQAANWARYWRNEIQGYIHAYRAATGVDLTAEPVNSTLPSVLLMRRWATQRPVAR